MTNLTIGQRIARERKKKELSQVGLATILDVSRQAISKWESDAAIPEIDKLIALSRLFGVSVGWLLGVEDPTAPQQEPLTEDQFRTVEELVKKYQMPPKPHLTGFHYLFAIGISLFLFLFLYGQTTRIGQQLQRAEDAYQEISTRLALLENSVQIVPASGDLLADYSFDLYPYTKTKSTHRVKVSFSAIPHMWNQGDTGYLCFSNGDGRETLRTECRWDGTQLTAQVDLDVADGYGISFAVTHGGGSQEQQLLEDPRIEKLAKECSIPVQISRGSIPYQDGTLTLTDYAASFWLPPIYQDQSTPPTVLWCEYQLYRHSRKDPQPQRFREDMMEQLEHGTMGAYNYQVSGETVAFENVEQKDCSHLELWFYVKLSSGVEQKHLITYLFPDGQGGFTE